MYYVGLDIHTKHISICVLSETGQLVRRCQVRGIEEMLGTLKGLPDRFEVCYEASCGYTPAEPDSASPGKGNSTPAKGGTQRRGDGVRVQEASGQDRGRDSGCIPGNRQGAVRRRWREWEQPHTLSWRSAVADDAEWMSGKSRARLALWS